MAVTRIIVIAGLLIGCIAAILIIYWGDIIRSNMTSLSSPKQTEHEITQETQTTNQTTKSPNNEQIEPRDDSSSPANQPQESNTSGQESFIPPLEKASTRVTKKAFGQFITPQNSPVQPERFSGYHTGTDFEVFPQEMEQDVMVKAVCTGTLISKRVASGYGGVAVQECRVEHQPITVVYGHVALRSIDHPVGKTLEAGEPLGILGTHKSSETDGERKHLHISFHNGREINIKGYVSGRQSLSDWIDPCRYICHNE